MSEQSVAGLPNNLIDSPELYELTPELRKLFEVESIDKGRPAETMAGLAYHVSRLHIFETWEDEIDNPTLQTTAVSLALHRIKNVATECHNRWGDIFENRNFRAQALREFAPERLKQISAEVDQSTTSRLTSPQFVEGNLMTMLIFLSTGHKKSLEHAHHMYTQLSTEFAEGVTINEQDLDEESKYAKILIEQLDASFRNIYRNATLNPSHAKRDTKRIYEKVLSGRFDAHIQASAPIDDVSKSALDVIEQEIPQELDFVFLPSETNLGDLARTIYAESTNTEKSHVDMNRVKLLADVRELYGADKCYFARGKATGRTYADDSGQRINEDYIVLVMQNHDENGIVTGEDALAVSPIAGKHAAYLARHDVSQGLVWRELFQLSKSDAQDLDVRRLKFSTVQGEELMDTMQEKILTLLTCPPEDFLGDLRRNKSGYKLVQRRKLGGRALRVVSQLETNS